MGRAARIFLALACVGCDDGDDDRAAPPDPPGFATLSYANGHPLDWNTDDAGVLENEDDLLALVNTHRASIGRNALAHDPALRRCARGHSRHMRSDVHGFYAHVNPEGDDPGGRLLKNGAFWTAAGENLVAGPADPRAAFDAWMGSPGHKANLEDGRWRRTGVGYQPGSGGPGTSTYWSQLFTD